MISIAIQKYNYICNNKIIFMNSGARLKKFFKHRIAFRRFRRHLSLEMLIELYRVYGFIKASVQINRSLSRYSYDFTDGGTIGSTRLALIGTDRDTPECIISSELFEAKRVVIPDNVILFGLNDKLKSISDECK